MMIAVSCIRILQLYRKRLFELRQGKYFFNKPMYLVYSASNFIGLQVRVTLCSTRLL